MKHVWHVSVTHDVLFNDRIEVEADTQDEAIELAKSQFAADWQRSELVEVAVVDVERVC